MEPINQAFVNGNILTINDEQPYVEAIGIAGNTITLVGTNEKIKSYINAQTNVIDLEGRTLMPGIIDAHAHLTISGINLADLNCDSDSVQSIEDLTIAIKEAAKNTPEGEWIRIWGFNEQAMKEQRYPILKELDNAAPEHPIVIVRMCNHISIVNSFALELAGLNEWTEDVPGGKYGRDEQKKLNGILYENAHMKMSKIFAHNEEEMVHALRLANDYFLSLGITSVHDAGGYGSGVNVLDAMKRAVDEEKVKVRIYAIIGSLTDSEQFIDDMLERNAKTGDGDTKLRIGPAKLFTDGSSTGPTIGTREGYTSDSEDKGILYYTQEELNDILGKAHKAGYQVTAHAQGDRAVEMMIDCIENALTNHPRSDHRHRIEHAGITQPDLQKRIKQLGIVPIPNPAFIYFNGDSYVENYGERVSYMYPLHDFQEKGVIAPIGSDAPVVALPPFVGISAAVNRTSKSGQKIGTNQTVTLMNALKAYTIDAAYASFEENLKGSIEEGKLADVIELDKNIFDVSNEDFGSLTVEKTFIDGELVYSRGY